MANTIQSQPKFMDLVLTNGTDFVGLFYAYYQEEGSSPTLDQWYWLKTLPSGEIIDKRQNKIIVGGQAWWTVRTGAVSNPPAGYGGVAPSDDFRNTREWGYKPSWLFSTGYEVGGVNISFTKAKENIREWVNAGCTYVAFGIPWEDVFLSLSAQNTNADSSWARYDELANFIKSLNPTVKIAIRVVVFKEARNHNDVDINYDPTNNFWPLSDSQVDSYGKLNRGIYDRNSFSYCDANATSQAIDFITKVKNRYSSIMGAGRLMWLSVAATAEEEAGYNFRNDTYNDLYPAIFDYSNFAKTAFRTFCQNKYGNNIQSLNSAWGSSYSQFSQVEPPYPNGPNQIELSLTFSGNKGNDWWYFGESVMAAFHISCKNAVSNACKYAVEFGSCTDIEAIRRYSINVLGSNNYSDLIKAQFEAIASKPQTSISVDVIRSNYSGKIGTELNTADYSQFPTEPNVYSFIYNTGVSAIQNNAMDILFISSANNPQEEDSFYQAINAFKALKIYAESNNTRVVPVRTVNYAIWQILNDPLFLIRKFEESGGFSSRLNLKITENPVLPPTPGDTGGIKKSEFSFVQKTNGNPVPTEGGGQVNGYVLFAAPSHGIVFKVPDPVGTQIGLQCKLEYTIKNSAGETIFTLKDNYGGFHPNYANNPDAESYRRVWTPSFGDYENLKFVRDFYNDFTPISGTPFQTANDRANNHFSPYYKYIPAGIYSLEIKNTGIFPFSLRAGRNDVFDQIPVGGTVTQNNVRFEVPPDNNVYTFPLHVLNDGSGNGYKMNTYIFP